MKKKVSVKEFRNYCKQHKISQISFCTENQRWYRVADPCKIQITFPIMLIYENPNLIYLKRGSDVLKLDRVQYVEIDSETTVLGDIFTVFCGRSVLDGLPEITYTFIAA